MWSHDVMHSVTNHIRVCLHMSCAFASQRTSSLKYNRMSGPGCRAYTTRWTHHVSRHLRPSAVDERVLPTRGTAFPTASRNPCVRATATMMWSRIPTSMRPWVVAEEGEESAFRKPDTLPPASAACKPDACHTSLWHVIVRTTEEEHFLCPWSVVAAAADENHRECCPDIDPAADQDDRECCPDFDPDDPKVSGACPPRVWGIGGYPSHPPETAVIRGRVPPPSLPDIT